MQTTLDTLEHEIAKQNKKRRRLEVKRQKQEAAAKAAETNIMRPHDNTSNTLVDSTITISSKHPDNLPFRSSSSPAKDLKMDVSSDIRHNGSPGSSVSYAPDELHRQESIVRHFVRSQFCCTGMANNLFSRDIHVSAKFD